MFAGIPCHLVSGLRRSYTDEQLSSFVTAALVSLDAIRAWRPLGIVLEEVPGVLQPRFHEFLEALCDCLQSQTGYSWGASVLDALLLGSLSTRSRIFFVGVLR